MIQTIRVKRQSVAILIRSISTKLNSFSIEMNTLNFREDHLAMEFQKHHWSLVSAGILSVVESIAQQDSFSVEPP
jgi:hypothetical protein